MELPDDIFYTDCTLTLESQITEPGSYELIINNYELAYETAEGAYRTRYYNESLIYEYNIVGHPVPEFPFTIQPEPGVITNIELLQSLNLSIEEKYGMYISEEPDIYFTFNGNRYCDASVSNFMNSSSLFVNPTKELSLLGEYELVIEPHTISWTDLDTYSIYTNSDRIVYSYIVDPLYSQSPTLTSVYPTEGSSVNNLSSITISNDTYPMSVSEVTTKKPEIRTKTGEIICTLEDISISEDGKQATWKFEPITENGSYILKIPYQYFSFSTEGESLFNNETYFEYKIVAWAKEEQAVVNIVSYNNYFALEKLSDNGEWAVGYGSNEMNPSYPMLYDVKNNIRTNLFDDGDVKTDLGMMACDVTDDGLKVAGQYDGKPAIWYPATAEWKTLPYNNSSLYPCGVVTSITPDGNYAIGTIKTRNKTNGVVIINQTIAVWNLTESVPVDITPDNIPKSIIMRDEQLDHESISAIDISADGTKFIGIVGLHYPGYEWTFMYDMTTKTWDAIGYEVTEDGDDYIFKPTGKGYMSMEGGQFHPGKNEIVGLFYHDNLAKGIYVYDIDSKKISIVEGSYDKLFGGIDQYGLIYASNSADDISRNWEVKVEDDWYDFKTIAKRLWGMDWQNDVIKDEFGFSGTLRSVSDNGLVLLVNADSPLLSSYATKQNSYIIELNEPLTDLRNKLRTQNCREVTLNYNGRVATLATAEEGATIYYSLGDDDPSIEYDNEPVDVGGLVTLRAAAKKDGFNDSEVMTYEVKYYADEEHAVVSEAGNLADCFGWSDDSELGLFEDYCVEGPLNETDYAVFGKMKSMQHLDIEKVSSAMVPANAFRELNDEGQPVKGLPLISVKLPAEVESYGSGLFDGCDILSSVVFNGTAKVTDEVLSGANNPNMLIYLARPNETETTLANGRNIVRGDVAQTITLTDSMPFHAARDFTANEISFVRKFTKQSGIGEAAGWETITIPFEAQSITDAAGNSISPFAADEEGDKKFWLFSPSSDDWTRTGKIEAYRPYLISMPYHPWYGDDVKIHGNVTFTAHNVTVAATADSYAEDYTTGVKMVAAYMPVEKSANVSAINDQITADGDAPGSHFVKGLREVRPFECYLTGENLPAKMPIFDSSDIEELMGDAGFRVWSEGRDICIYSPLSIRLMVYDYDGRLMRIASVRGGETTCLTDFNAGIYIVGDTKIYVK